MKLSMRSRKQQLLSFAAAFAIVGGLSVAGFNGSVPVPSVAAAADLLSVLKDRSPGERTNAGLLQKIKKLAMGGGELPSQRALSNVRGPRAVPADIGAAALPGGSGEIPVFPPETPFLDEAPFFAPPGSGLPNLPLPFPGGVINPPGGGGGIITPPGGGIITPPIIIPPSVSPVPEPETWMTMIIGFGAVGIALRRRRKLSLSSNGLRETNSEAG